MHWTLHRMYLAKGTLGVMEAHEFGIAPTFWILEDLPGNGPDHCVPEGVYKLEPHSGAKYRDHFALVNRDLNVLHWEESDVEGERSTVLIHLGNRVVNTTGCLLIGFMAKPDEPMVYNSKIAIDAFHATMRNNPQLRELRIQRG